jgi:uncharacterized protein DUF3313
MSLLMRRFVIQLVLVIVAFTLVISQGFTADKAPKTTPEGLELRKETKSRVVYVKPGATFTQYQKFALVDCYVEFSKKWLDDYNSSTLDLSRRITEQDLDKARKDLAAQFKKVFTEELTKGGYQVSETTGPDVLVLRPALINIAVNAPDLMTPGRSRTYASSAGQMTLYLELWDSASNTLLGRVVDARADSDMYVQRMTSVDNRAAADMALRSWATELRKKLELAQGKPVD